MPSLFEELKRRNVFRVAAAYAAIAWLLAQVADTFLPAFGLPPAYLRSFFVLLGLGFPVAVVLAWIYDITPEGIERTDDSTDAPPARRFTGRKLDFVIIACLTVALLFLALDRYRPGDTLQAVNIRSIAVLPFDVTSGDLELVQFGVGIADSLILRLSRIPELKVKSRAALTAASENVIELGEALGVDAICRGRVVRRGQILEISAELVDVSDGTVIWNQRFRPQSSNLVSVDADITGAIANRLDLELAPGDRLATTADPEAHKLYLQGRYFWNRRTELGLRQSAERFQQAVALDPDYALAWSGLADSYFMLFAWGFESPDDAARRVMAAAERAVDLDPTLAAPLATIAYFKTIYERDWAGAREYFDRAIVLNSNYSTAHHWQAFFLSTMGEHAAALAAILRARDFEPLSPVINSEVALFHLYAGQPEEALAEVDAAERLDSDFAGFDGMRMRAYGIMGDTASGTAAWDRLRSMGDFGIVFSGFHGIALPALDRVGDARQIYDRGLASRATGYVAPGVLGILAASIGELDAAFGHFEEAYAERSLIMSWLRDPLLADMRADPRYAELMQRAGLEP